jgi:diguanylate cyclase (GGDEF)-like protein/PAS domain S-box-containing protein
MEKNKIKILTIDDQKENLITISAVLEDIFPQAVILKEISGVDGLRTAKLEDPDVILLDIVMPIMDGFEVCSLIKSDRILKDIPVIFLTALGSEKQIRIKALESGGDAFLSKPIDEIELTAQINAMIKIRKGNLDKREEKGYLESLLNEKMRDIRESEKRYRGLVENLEAGVVIHAKDTSIIFSNRKAEELLGFGSDLLKGEKANSKKFSFVDLNFKKLDSEQFPVNIVINTKSPLNNYILGIENHQNKQIKWVSVNGILLRDDFGDIKEIVVSFVDITEINIANEKLKNSERKYRLLVDMMPLSMVHYEIIFDDFGEPVDFVIMGANRAFEKLTMKKNEELIGKTISEVYPETEQYWIDQYAKVAKDSKTRTFDHYARAVDKHLKLSAFKLEPTKMAVILADVTVDMKKQNEIIYLSHHDFLTGLYNRRYFVQEYKKLDDEKQYPLCLMMIDINGLKIINDAFGHNEGDNALQKVADTCSKIFREQDVIARIGGDEFAILLPNTEESVVEKLNLELKTVLKNTLIKNVALSVATGYVTKDSKSKGDLDEILKLAENHMYRHKLAEGISNRNNAIQAILKTLTEKYDEERIHSANVSKLCKMFGEVLDFEEEDLKELELAGMYHDIGKISIPDVILYKTGRLSNEEFEIIKTHPEIGYQILRAADKYSDLAIHALHHHERWDGRGYPKGLKGEEIPYFSRIICVADSYEAMTSERPYKDKMSKSEAVKEIIRCAGSQFDKSIAKIFVTKVLKSNWE